VTLVHPVVVPESPDEAAFLDERLDERNVARARRCFQSGITSRRATTRVRTVLVEAQRRER